MSQEKPRPASGPKILFNILFAAFVFWVIYTMPKGERLQAFLYLTCGTYFLIVFARLFFLHRKFSMNGGYLLFYSGGLLVVLFIIWLGNWLLTVSFKVGHLFPEIYDFIFSLPGLICGLILIAAGILWEHNDSRTMALKNAFLSGK
jgi:hypothetical protein